MALTLGDNFSYQGAKPLDARLKYDTLAAMKAVADSTMYAGCMAYCMATDKTYQWKSTNTVDEDTGKWREFSSGSGDTIQVDTLPTAGADELGNVYQYIGSTTLTLTHGYFYECVSDGAGTPTYYWEEVSTSKGGHDIKNDGVAVTARDTMNFTDFDIEDDPTNKETDIKAHRLTASELTYICSPLPGAVSDMPVLFDARETEYVVGWYVFSDGTKKPVYEKTVYFGALPNANTKTVTLETKLYADYVVSCDAMVKVEDNSLNMLYFRPLSYATSSTSIIGIYVDSHKTSGDFRINIATTTDRSGEYAYVTLRYTKSTDTPS